jgi:RND family efflux transporter MFP subunit
MVQTRGRRRLAGSLGLLTASLVALALSGCSRQEPAPEPVRAVRTVMVQPGQGEGVLEYAGDIRARVESALGFRVGGKITRRLVELGQPVNAGQVLAQLDPTDLRLGQEAARASVNAAQVNRDQVAADVRRFRELRAQGFISAAELERHESSLKAAEASLAQARAQAGVQVNQAGYASLLADAAGVITGVEAEPGQVVSPGMPVVRLAHDGPRDVVFTVPEDGVTAVRELRGKPGAIKVRRWGQAATLPATVREVAAAADPVTRTFIVKADIGRADVSLGQTATVQIDNRTPGSAVRLPLTALLRKDGKTAVWVLDGRALTVSLQPVQVASVGRGSVLLASGLRPGQEVVTAGVHVLQPGQKVKRYIEPGAASAAAAAAATTPAGAGR